jgi:competence protein ComEC
VQVDWVAEVAPGDPLARASNRVRDVLERGSTALPFPDSALFRGLVLGDDADQPPDMVDRFRASGLSHLTAVSGQNVAFMLAAAGPLLRRLRPIWRWLATLGLIGWFVALTRFEPSIIRAGAMAALSATAFVFGRERHPARILCIAVTVLLLVDPLLVRSVGFWLSAGATAGVTTVGPWLAPRLRPLGLLATPVAVTLGAQAGVAVPALLVFGRLPLVSIPANVLAAPVAGFVMLYGLPAGLIAGAIPAVAPAVMLPCRFGVRWVDVVAMLGARLEPGGRASAAGWLLVIGIVIAIVARASGENRPSGR